MKYGEILAWLKEQHSPSLDELWRLADRARRDNVGGDVHLRGLVEVSNHCVRRCAYCGIRMGNRALRRYRIPMDEIFLCALRAVSLGYGTIVIQAGEDYGLETRPLAELIMRIKAETPLAVTLSLGERPPRDLAAWRKAGADRYLLRFETSNLALYKRIHPSPPGRRSDRFAMIRALRALGYQTGSGVMVGIPGQTYDDLANDVVAFARLGLDMIGLGPWIAHPATPLGQKRLDLVETPEQAPNSALMTYKMIALARIVCPCANIPATSALATLDGDRGRLSGLRRGANVVMPNLTPLKYRSYYEIYPGKACNLETPGEFDARLKSGIAAVGRTVGRGRGDSRVTRIVRCPVEVP